MCVIYPNCHGPIIYHSHCIYEYSRVSPFTLQPGTPQPCPNKGPDSATSPKITHCTLNAPHSFTLPPTHTYNLRSRKHTHGHTNPIPRVPPRHRQSAITNLRTVRGLRTRSTHKGTEAKVIVSAPDRKPAVSPAPGPQQAHGAGLTQRRESCSSADVATAYPESSPSPPAGEDRC